MEKVLAIFLKVCCIIFCVGLLYGFIGPYTISEPDSNLVYLGVFIVPIGSLLIIWLVSDLVKTLIKCVEGTNEKR